MSHTRGRYRPSRRTIDAPRAQTSRENGSIVVNVNGTGAQANPENVFKPVGPNTCDMAILKNIKVKGEVLTPGDKGYEESVKRWAGNAERKAGYVVFVENAGDISNTVICIIWILLT